MAACGDGSSDKKPASQVVAKVNSGEISIHQLNFLLQHLPGLAPEKADEARRRILEELVDQELAVQQALAAKLDRDPKVMQTLEAARRQILAQAYLEKTTAGKGKPSEAEVKAYYRDHPELFAQRKIYRLQEIGFPAQPEVVATVRDQISKSKRSEDLMAALRAHGITAAGAVMVKPAENIALDILPQLSRMQDGQSAIFENGQRASLVTLIGTVPEPLSEETARPRIEQFLSHRRVDEMAKATIEGLRKQARIEYAGEFGKDAEAARQAREADAARDAQAAKAARENARLAEAAEAAKRAEAAKKAREAAQAASARAPGRLPAPPDSTVNRGLSALK
ncbi:MAG: epsD [Rhodocyclaceae bacterium]|nr:epsD [Rhodocyclaceae bacterium]